MKNENLVQWTQAQLTALASLILSDRSKTEFMELNENEKKMVIDKMGGDVLPMMQVNDALNERFLKKENPMIWVRHSLLGPDLALKRWNEIDSTHAEVMEKAGNAAAALDNLRWWPVFFKDHAQFVEWKLNAAREAKEFHEKTISRKVA